MRPAAAPRLDERLHRVVERAPRMATAAEVTRAVGDIAWELGLVRPSYQQIRVVLAERRLVTEHVSDVDVLIDVIFQNRPGWDLANRRYGDPLPWRPNAKNEPRTS